MIINKLPKRAHNLKFNQPIKRWDEAIMLGNGHMGCLIWGDSRELRMSLDRGDIWDKRPYPGVLEEDFTYQKLVQLARQRETEAIRKQFDAPYYHPTPTKIPAGKLLLDFKVDKNIVSELDLATATAYVNIGEGIQLTSYLHAEQQVGWIKVKGAYDQMHIHLENPEFGRLDEAENIDYHNKPIESINLKSLKYEAPIFGEEEGIKYFIQKIEQSCVYGILLAQKQTPSGLELAYKIVVHNSEPEQWIEQEKQKVLEALNKGYEACWQTHKAWWEKFWSQSVVSLPDQEFEKQWYLINYFLGSASRKGAMPMPLQGVWTADEGTLPPWKGDYHNDLNTQMSYYHYLKANHLEEGESFIDFLWNLVPTAKAFAKRFYGAEGICLPAVMSMEGVPLGGWPMYSLSPTQQLWLCQAFERHYRFSGDRVFLEEKAYPYLKESATFILEILETNEEGKLVLPVSSSAEIHDDSAESWVTPNSNYDLSFMIYLFKQLKKMAEELNNGEVGKWEEVLQKLPDLAVNSRNVLMISPDESLMESHRHFAHAMAIHPLRLLDYQQPEHKKIIDSTIANLERLSFGLWVGYSFTWLAEFYAVQKNGEGAYYQLKLFFENFCSPNGFHLNGDYKRRGLSAFHYRPFTLEGNFCAADAIQEMLMQTDYNQIELFPAIPDHWKDQTIEFETLRAEKGMLVSAKYVQGKIKSVRLEPQYDGTYQIVGEWGEMALTPDCIYQLEGNRLQVELKGGRIYQLEG